MKQVILFSTHILNDYILSQITKIHNEIQGYADMYVLLQTDQNGCRDSINGVEVYPFSIETLNSLGYKPWARTIVPGSNHFPVLQFYRENPQYDYYWNIEYDVLYTGNWKDFLQWFDDKDDDFVSSHIESISENPSWIRWNEMDLIETSIHKEQYIKSFNPIYRISNKAISFLDSFLSNGNKGHHELLLPTVLNYYGYSIKDLGGAGRFSYEQRDLFYTHDSVTTENVMSTMRYRPLWNIEQATLPNKLYHPIKEVGLNHNDAKLDKYDDSVDLTLWVTYHDDKQIGEFNLKNDGCYKLFKGNDTKVIGDNINYLNKFYSEIVTFYYVWKNQIKSNQIGFCHYRRMFDEVCDVDAGQCQVFEIIHNSPILGHYKWAYNFQDMYDILDILNNKYGQGNKYSDYILKGTEFVPCCCFVMQWEDFNRLCNWLFPILFAWDKKNGLNMEAEKYLEKAKRDFRYDNVDYQCRAIAFLAERLISCYIVTEMNPFCIDTVKR